MTSLFDFVRAKRGPQHHCHWPGCSRVVTPRYWGCRMHLRMLPERIRKRLWNAYVEGQEITKMPTKEYIDAAKEARDYVLYCRMLGLL